MAGVYKLEIAESEEALKELLRQQKTVTGKERVQLVYLLKSRQVETVAAAARMLGRHRVTVQEWLKLYREGGLEKMLTPKPRKGRERQLPEGAREALKKRLAENRGFNSYREIVGWLEENLGIQANYKTVYGWVHYGLGASPKVARPKSYEQETPAAEDFKKKLAENLAMLGFVAMTMMGLGTKVRFFCEDETRIGLKTISGRKITLTGVKPIGEVQWKFQATYLYGVVEPSTGESFFYEFTHLNSNCFQIFLNLVSQQFADSVLIIQLDRGGFHRAKKLQIPENIILLFQPAHSPELNPIEQVWQYLKSGLRWKLPRSLDELRQDIKQRLQEMTPEIIASITGRKSILEALSVAGL